MRKGRRPRTRKRGRASDRRGLGVSKAALEQHRLGEAASLIESLKSNAHLIIDTRKRKNLIHLQSILLFKDSSGWERRESSSHAPPPEERNCAPPRLKW